MTDIDLGKLTDRELLLLTAQKVNESCEAGEDRERRIHILESKVSWIIGLLASSGVLGGGVYSVIKWG